MDEIEDQLSARMGHSGSQSKTLSVIEERPYSQSHAGTTQSASIVDDFRSPHGSSYSRDRSASIADEHISASYSQDRTATISDEHRSGSYSRDQSRTGTVSEEVSSRGPHRTAGSKSYTTSVVYSDDMQHTGPSQRGGPSERLIQLAGSYPAV